MTWTSLPCWVAIIMTGVETSTSAYKGWGLCFNPVIPGSELFFLKFLPGLIWAVLASACSLVVFWEDSWGMPRGYLGGWGWSGGVGQCYDNVWPLWRVLPLSTRVLIWALPESAALSALKNANDAQVLMLGIITHTLTGSVGGRQNPFVCVSPCMHCSDVSFSSCIIYVSVRVQVGVRVLDRGRVGVLFLCWREEWDWSEWLCHYHATKTNSYILSNDSHYNYHHLCHPNSII